MSLRAPPTQIYQAWRIVSEMKAARLGIDAPAYVTDGCPKIRVGAICRIRRPVERRSIGEARDDGAPDVRYGGRTRVRRQLHAGKRIVGTGLVGVPWHDAGRRRLILPLRLLILRRRSLLLHRRHVSIAGLGQDKVGVSRRTERQRRRDAHRRPYHSGTPWTGALVSTHLRRWLTPLQRLHPSIPSRLPPS